MLKKIIALSLFVLILSIPARSSGQETTYPVKPFEKVPFVSYAISDEKLIIGLDYQPGWGFGIIRYKFPDRLTLEVAFKENPPTVDAPEAEMVEYPDAFLLRDIRANIDQDGLRVSVSSKLSKFPFEYELDDHEDEKRLYVIIPLSYSSEIKKTIGEGLEYREVTMVNNKGPKKLHLLYVDTTQGRYYPMVLTAADFGRKLSTVKNMADRSGAVAAVNGGFYSNDGNHQGLLIRNGRLESYPNFNRPVFARTTDNKIHIGYLPLHGVLHGPGNTKIYFDSIDKKPEGSEVVLLTPGHPSRISSNLAGTKIVIKDYKVEKVTTESVEIKKNRYILWSVKERGDFKKLREGDPIELELGLGIEDIEIETALGAGPLLVTGGKVNVTNEQDYPRDIMSGRAPRTGIGVTGDGYLVLAVLEGRNPDVSMGSTIVEFAELMKKYGAVVAMNLDGGGSSSMVVDGQQMSQIPNGGRSVTNVIAIFDRERKEAYF
jgi:uncharacterized protein YigE (DUF2233 family)